MCTVWHVDKYKITLKLVINPRRTSRGPVQLMPGPGTGPRPGGWETLPYNIIYFEKSTLITSSNGICLESNHDLQYISRGVVTNSKSTAVHTSIEDSTKVQTVWYSRSLKLMLSQAGLANFNPQDGHIFR